MRLNRLPLAIFYCSVAFLALSCEKEVPLDPSEVAAVANPNGARVGASVSKQVLKKKAEALSNQKTDGYREMLLARVEAKAKGVVDQSTCSNTPFRKTADAYLAKFKPFELGLYGEYSAINYFASLLDASKPYFGAKGEYTSLVDKHRRNLESFWKMPSGQVSVRGEHNSTLNDRDKIADVYMNYGGYPRGEAYRTADDLIAVNRESQLFIETPLLSFDAFATLDGIIVLGDGLIQVLSESGIAGEVANTGILAHEWGHQIQFAHDFNWFEGQAHYGPRTPEFSLLMELEADFFSSYYLTHKKGAMYNWKNAAQFFNLFYNVGDCNFTSTNHHGTPLQRLTVARLGWIVAQVSKAKGHVLNSSDIHSLFIAGFTALIENKNNHFQAIASLSNDELRTIYKDFLKHDKELKEMLKGNLSQNRIENL